MSDTFLTEEVKQKWSKVIDHPDLPSINETWKKRVTAVVLENTVVEPGSIYAGIPAKKVKSVSPEKLQGEIHRIADNYVKYSGWFREPGGE